MNHGRLWLQDFLDSLEVQTRTGRLFQHPHIVEFEPRNVARRNDTRLGEEVALEQLVTDGERPLKLVVGLHLFSQQPEASPAVNIREARPGGAACIPEIHLEDVDHVEQPFMPGGAGKVVERERIQFILDEIQRSDATISGQKLADPEFAVRVGKLLGAQSMLIGSYMKFNNKLRLDTRLVKTETSEIIKTESVEGKADEIFELSKRLAIKISEDLEVALNQAEEENLERMRKEEIPLEAAMAYSEALKG